MCACVLESGPQRNQGRLPQTSSVSTCASSFLFSLSFFRLTNFSRSSFLSICYIRLSQNPNSIESPTRLMQTRKVINPVLSFLLSAVTIAFSSRLAPQISLPTLKPFSLPFSYSNASHSVSFCKAGNHINFLVVTDQAYPNL